MHPFLDRLGVRPEVQEFFRPFYQTDDIGNLVFAYGDDIEHFGFAFHRVPVSGHLWIAGNNNVSQVRHVFICSSAMEAIAYFHIHFSAYQQLDNLLFVATGAGLDKAHISWINTHLPDKTYSIVFGNDILGRVASLELAAGIRQKAVAIKIQDDQCVVSFRHQDYWFDMDAFSLNAFEKKTGYRFNIRTHQPKTFTSYFDQLKAAAFNP